MNHFQTHDFQDPPPPYARGEEPDPVWKLRNIRHQSSFVSFGRPRTQDFRNHLANIKTPYPGDGLAFENLPLQASSAKYTVSYKQALGHISRFLEAFHACSREIRPLTEEDLLFLLLSRFAEQSDATVYVEIRRAHDLQVFDSTIIDPLHADAIQEHLNDVPGILDAELTGQRADELEQRPDYDPLPQTPSEAEVPCTVTINYPAIIPLSGAVTDLGTVTPQHLPQSNVYPQNDWALLPEKLQPPSFHVRRCHQEEVALAASEPVELPIGFPEVVQYFNEVPVDFYHVALYINHHSWLSPPYHEGGAQSFECHLGSSTTSFYITVERDGHTLVYNCYRDEEMWIMNHVGQQDCSGY